MLEKFLRKELPHCQIESENHCLAVVCPEGRIRQLDLDELILAFIKECQLMYRQDEFHPIGGMIVADQSRKEFALKVTIVNLYTALFTFKEC